MNETQYPIRKFDLRMFLIKRRADATRQNIIDALRDCKHSMRQNINDYKRRGMSNREGRDNRRMRKFNRENNETVIFSCAAFDIVK